MRRLHVWLPLCILAGACGLYLAHLDHGQAALEHPTAEAPAALSQSTAKLLDVTAGPMSVWSEYTGHVEAREVVELASRLGGSATIVYLAAEGSVVKKGDVLTRFDTSDAERNLVKLNQDYDTANSEMQSLEKAELPIERSDLQLQVDEQANKVKLEDKFITDSEDLVKQGLMSEEELGQERTEADKEHRELTGLQSKLDLTTRYLQPLKVQQARTKLLAAQQALALGKRQLDDSTISAPEAGVLDSVPCPSAVNIAWCGSRACSRTSPSCTCRTTAVCGIGSAGGGSSTTCRVALRWCNSTWIQFKGSVQSVGSVARGVPDQPGLAALFPDFGRHEVSGKRAASGMTVSVRSPITPNPRCSCLARPCAGRRASLAGMERRSAPTGVRCASVTRPERLRDPRWPETRDSVLTCTNAGRAAAGVPRRVKRYATVAGEVPALTGVDFSIHAGEFVMQSPPAWLRQGQEYAPAATL